MFQRIQTVFLFVAVSVCAACFFLPFWNYISESPAYNYQLTLFSVKLISGNIQIIGCTRLYRAELFSEMCAIGAYGDMASTRAELVPVAIEHLEHKLKMRIRPSDVVVIGDTVKDIECAREAGVSVIAVATGGSTYEKLEAAQPDLLVMDFVSGHDAVMAYLKK